MTKSSKQGSAKNEEDAKKEKEEKARKHDEEILKKLEDGKGKAVIVYFRYATRGSFGKYYKFIGELVDYYQRSDGYTIKFNSILFLRAERDPLKALREAKEQNKFSSYNFLMNAAYSGIILSKIKDIEIKNLD